MNEELDNMEGKYNKKGQSSESKQTEMLKMIYQIKCDIQRKASQKNLTTPKK